MRVAIIGGGAAGFFAAFSVKVHHPNAHVVIFEKSKKVLSKVKVSGGGRCNVTHDCQNNRLMSAYYPRGARLMRNALDLFGVKHTIEWFENRGVELKTEADGRMFPITDNSQSIIDCFLKEANALNIQLRLSTPVQALAPQNEKWALSTTMGMEHFDRVIVATGGSAKHSGFEWLEKLGHKIAKPVPSLFTFNIPKNPITDLMGVSVNEAAVRIVGTKHQYHGPLLITHWGMSGPAVLKTSAFAALDLAERDYQFECAVNWLGDTKEHDLRDRLEAEIPNLTKRKVYNRNPLELPARLWEFLLHKIELNEDRTWGELGSKQLNRLVNVLTNDIYAVNGKTTFKEEFVTAGGVSLESIDQSTLESKSSSRLYFAGEVLNIDGVTGGFNFQAAWTTGFIAGQLG
ncbi:MAG: NAD(P)/FAD-dependent oxidoreductase [Salibacteraceae bacterium]